MEKIYVVWSYGGTCSDDAYDSIEKAFRNKEDADKYIADNQVILDVDTLLSIQDYVNSQLHETVNKKFFDNEGLGELKEGYTDDEYLDAYDDFTEETKYKIIEEKFNISREKFNRMEEMYFGTFGGYYITEVELV